MSCEVYLPPNAPLIWLYKVNIDDSLCLPGPTLDAVVHVHSVPGPGDAGGAGLQVVTVREEPAVALVRIPGPEQAPGGHRTSVLT